MSKSPESIFPARMVETAYKYAKVAQLALKERLGTQSEVNAALSIEILLKSVQAKSVNKGNDYISMRFSSKHGHNLLELYNTVPPTTKKRLGIESYKETFTEKKDVFITSRYDYEANAPSSSTDTLLQIAARLIPVGRKVIMSHSAQSKTEPLSRKVGLLCAKADDASEGSVDVYPCTQGPGFITARDLASPGHFPQYGMPAPGFARDAVLQAA